ETMALDKLERRGAQAVSLFEQALALLPGLHLYTSEERAASAGKLRDGEDKALGGVLNGADYMPVPFNVLAAKDHGFDDTRFETNVLRDRLARREVLAPVANKVQQ